MPENMDAKMQAQSFQGKQRNAAYGSKSDEK